MISLIDVTELAHVLRPTVFRPSGETVAGVPLRPVETDVTAQPEMRADCLDSRDEHEHAVMASSAEPRSPSYLRPRAFA